MSLSDRAGYVPSGYEKGHAAYDIGQILTRHRSFSKGDVLDCARAHDLRLTTRRGISVQTRLESALAIKCTCDAGDSDSERTSL